MPVRRLGLGIAAVVAGVALFYAVIGYADSANMFGNHPRWRGMNRGPADFGLQGETVSFEAEDGVPLKAWWLPAAGRARGAVIVAHGIDHTRQVMLPRASFLVQGGYDALLVDLRGHGESGGAVVSPGLLEMRDVLGAARYIRSRGNNEPIVALGISYGAVACLLAAAESPEIAAVVADGAFVSGKDVSDDIARHFLQDARTGFWVRVLFRISSFPGAARATALVYYFRSGIWLGPELLSVLRSARRIKVPVLLISGARDWIAPTYRTERILSAIPDSQKELIVIPGAAHDTTYSTAPKLYAGAVLNFLRMNVH